MQNTIYENTFFYKIFSKHHKMKFIRTTLIVYFSIFPLEYSFAQDYYFDTSLLKGTSLNQDLDKYNEKESFVPSGAYVLDIYVNDYLVAPDETVSILVGHTDSSAPCLSSQQIEKIGVKSAKRGQLEKNNCMTLSNISDDIQSVIDISKSRLNLAIPQSELLRNPRGYIPVKTWDAGTLALFLRHNTNVTRTANTDSNFKYSYIWSNINSGTNIGLWQLRHTGNLRYVDDNYNGHHYKYNAVRTWVQRPLPELESTVTLGDTYTNTSLFGSLPFNGIKIASDTRMWPQGRRGYAPEVRGVAVTTARVVIRQQNNIVYETTVPPGPFVISDLYNTRSEGDLDVKVVEANGNISTFTVPYSSVPDSIRPGNWEYSLSLGRVRNYYSVNNKFIEGTLQRGLSNALTTNSGLRIADRYQAGLLGFVVATDFGAFGLNTTFSNAEVENNETHKGWRAEASYSKTFNAGTNLVLAAYRYSTSGFRDLQDVLGVRRQNEYGTDYWSDTLKQKNKFSATLSQPMGMFGIVNLAGSISDYYGDRGSIKQLQLGYSNDWRFVNYNLSIARQQSVIIENRYFYSVSDSDYDISNRKKINENTVSLNFSIPLDFGESRSNMTLGLNKGNDNRSAQLGLNGSAGEQGNLTYSVFGGVENYQGTGNSSAWGGSIQKNTSIGAIRANVSTGKNYRQVGAGYSGTLVAHSGGVTAGPYTGETFALIHAPGAKGAIVRNGQGSTIDRFGYAINPSLTPYQYNNIALDSRFIEQDVELQGGSIRLVPYAGAISLVKFQTIYGRAILIDIDSNGVSPPMGADVFDSNNKSVGIVGQGGQIYARVESDNGKLNVKWGERLEQKCSIKYNIKKESTMPVTQISTQCIRGN